MEAKDLKIGNIVEYLGFSKIIGINGDPEDTYSQAHVETEDSFEWTAFKHLKPIPLTEEIHNKFGVTKNGFGNFEYELPMKFNISIKVIHTNEYIMLRQGTNNPRENDVISIWNRDITKRDMFVHEWQNLYFALCGEELIIKGSENETKI